MKTESLPQLSTGKKGLSVAHKTVPISLLPFDFLLSALKRRLKPTEVEKLHSRYSWNNSGSFLYSHPVDDSLH